MEEYRTLAVDTNRETTERSGEQSLAISVVVAVRDPERAAPLGELYRDYREQLEKVGRTYEFIFALEGDQPENIETLRALREEGEPITVLVFEKWYGGATALSAGFDHASGSVLLTLPAYHQIDPEAIPTLFPALEDSDMVVVRRWPRQDGWATQLQVRGFHAVLRKLLGVEFNDLGCSVVAFEREVLDSIDMYGDQHRFLPVLTSHYGFRVKEVEAPQTEEDTFQRHLSFRAYVARILDLLSIFFLTRFTRKPLRFFGASGVCALVAGGGISTYLSVQRLFLGVPMRNRPVLILGVLLIVLGTLFLAIGLIGEMVMFTNAKNMKDYHVDRIVEGPET